MKRHLRDNMEVIRFQAKTPRQIPLHLRDKANDFNNLDSKLIQFGSFSLIETQSRYTTIELELLALVRAMEKSKFFLLGINSFSDIVDHRLLICLFQKDYLDIRKEHLAADALRRAPVFSSEPEPALEEYEDSVMSSRPGSHPQCLHESHPAPYFSSIWHDSLLDIDGVPKLCSVFPYICSDHIILHITSLPYNPQSNSIAESAVHCIKSLLKKSKSKNGFNESIMYLRSIVTPTNKTSLAKVFLGR
ncbi:unnamed protein product [Lepeophtheirus salmonis]|uniref:(salmon louse) hypothetical protein n=1 Tax=Lepeophtheirus salmonis TaxID=72036 RepID=A0A7R8H7N8_LEPSM|nr:unnamed protein product [Lepeophtheirus salmonis]CAF2922147.1 unnamed protein product [Lepeophtheirus salmonis]